MTQGSLPFKYEEEKKDFGSTSLTGLLIFLDLLHKMGFVQMVNRHLHAKADKQGWRDVQFLVSLLLLNISGGDCVDDIKLMEADDGLSRIMKHLELRHAFGRRRQKLKSQCRNGRKNVFPSPSAIFRYLLLFHNACQEVLRQEVKENQEIKAFIPAGNEHLIGLGGINKDMLEFFQLNRPCSTATIDMDATLVESQKKDALYGYKSYKCYQPLNAWWWIMLLALNLTSMLKCLALTKKWKRSRMKRIRYWLINVPGRVIFESKELIVRLTRGHPVFDMLVAARQRILQLGPGTLSPG